MARHGRWLVIRFIQVRKPTLESLISPRRLLEIANFSGVLVFTIIDALTARYISRVGKIATTLKLWWPAANGARTIQAQEMIYMELIHMPFSRLSNAPNQMWPCV